jgi:Radical SAM superfamily/Iron-sulfur cluster-binding domain
MYHPSYEFVRLARIDPHMTEPQCRSVPENPANRQAIEDVAQSLGLGSVEELLDFPLFLQFETVSTCNARCLMCPVDEWERATLLMRDDLFERLAKQVEPHVDTVRRITIQLDGEPLIDTKLEDRIGRLKKMGVGLVAFATNGSLMTRKRAERVLASGVDEVTFSIDGAEKETFEAIRRRLDFETVVENAKGFLALRDQMKADCRVRVRMAVGERNASQFPALKAFWSQFMRPGDAVYGKLLHNWGGWRTEYDLPNQISAEELNALPCQSPWTSLIVLTDGRVPLCCADYNAEIHIGDAYTQTIQDIWRNHLFETVRGGHLTQGRESLKMCIDCNMWDASTQVE